MLLLLKKHKWPITPDVRGPVCSHRPSQDGYTFSKRQLHDHAAALFCSQTPVCAGSGTGHAERIPVVAKGDLAIAVALAFLFVRLVLAFAIATLPAAVVVSRFGL